MKKYETPKISISEFVAEDILTTSVTPQVLSYGSDSNEGISLGSTTYKAVNLME